MSEELLSEIRDLLKRANELTEQALKRSEQVEAFQKKIWEDSKALTETTNEKMRLATQKFLKILFVVTVLIVAGISASQFLVE